MIYLVARLLGKDHHKNTKIFEQRKGKKTWQRNENMQEVSVEELASA